MAGLNSPAFIDWISTLAISIGAALVIATILSVLSGRLLKLEPEHRLWAFIVGFAFLASLASVPATESQTWSDSIFLFILPLMITFFYFLPTAAAINARNPAFHSVFILNLFFGWTLIGWIVALMWAVRRTRPVIQGSPGYRITPFGAVSDRKPTEGRPKSG
jgi:Superinfection immunity protein